MSDPVRRSRVTISSELLLQWAERAQDAASAADLLLHTAEDVLKQGGSREGARILVHAASWVSIQTGVFASLLTAEARLGIRLAEQYPGGAF